MPTGAVHEWLQAPVIAGLIGASIGAVPGFLALIYTRRVDKREQARDQPTMSVRLSAAKTPGWLDLQIHVRNGSDAAWLLETVSFPSAREVRAATATSLAMRDPYGGYETVSPTDENTAIGSVAINVEIAPRGAAQTFGRRADEYYEHVLFRCSSSRRRISIRISLRSMESDARRIVRTAHRDIPALTA